MSGSSSCSWRRSSAPLSAPGLSSGRAGTITEQPPPAGFGRDESEGAALALLQGHKVAAGTARPLAVQGKHPSQPAWQSGAPPAQLILAPSIPPLPASAPPAPAAPVPIAAAGDTGTGARAMPWRWGGSWLGCGREAAPSQGLWTPNPLPSITAATGTAQLGSVAASAGRWQRAGSRGARAAGT